MTALTLDDLKRIADEFLTQHYGMTLDIPLKRNNRLRRSMGRFLTYVTEDGGEEARAIEISGFMFDYAAESVTADTLLHECVHYALYRRGEPYDDGHPEFEAELKRHCIGSTETNVVGKYTVCKCAQCNGEWETTRRAETLVARGYVTGCCSAEIQIVGERIYNGLEAI